VSAPASHSLGLGYDDLGQGEPALLLLTGWCSSRARWALAAPLLAANRRVINFEWRGHGESLPATGDFGTQEMVQDALAVIAACGVGTFVPCAASHSGWVAIELRRRLHERIPGIVHLDWMVLEPTAAYMQLIEELRSEETWRGARERLFDIWRAGDESAWIAEAISVMRHQSAEMWMRSGREIQASYRAHRNPLDALAELKPPPRVLHLYGQPESQEYLQAQLRFQAEHEWFSVKKLDARTHFSMLERPEQVAAAIEAHVSALTSA